MLFRSEDAGSFSIEENADSELLRDRIATALESLKPQEQVVIRLRFGLNDGIPRTLEQCGQCLNVSRERARQIERNAIKKLRVNFGCSEFHDYLN